jgi:MOSC domain-containing protein YiiM
MAQIQAICVSLKKGTLKKPVEEALFRENWGIEDDAHAGEWHRQVSLLAGESIERVREVLPGLKDGAFAENIVTMGINLTELPVGSRLALGQAVVLEITQIGKECHNDGCAIKKATGDCIMPREGLFGRVVSGGLARPGDTITLLSRPAEE